MLGILKKLADEEGVSTNTLVNIILRNYIEWDRFALGAGFAVFQKEMVKAMVGLLDEESLNRIASKTADAYLESLPLMKGNDKFDSFMGMLKERSKRAGFAYREFVDSAEKRIVIYHDMGYKWSTYLKAHNEHVINKLGYPVQFTITENSLILKLPVER